MNVWQEDSHKRKNNSNNTWWIIMLLIGLFFSLADMDMDSGDVVAVIWIILFIITTVIIVAITRQALKKKKKMPQKENRTFSEAVPSSTFKETQTRNSPALEQKKYYDKDMIMQDDERDRERRLKQLDDFLKNGIIDKEEYKVLYSRYERGI